MDEVLKKLLGKELPNKLYEKSKKVGAQGYRLSARKNLSSKSLNVLCDKDNLFKLLELKSEIGTVPYKMFDDKSNATISLKALNENEIFPFRLYPGKISFVMEQVDEQFNPAQRGLQGSMLPLNH